MATTSTSLAFRILYATLYYALYLVLLGVLIVSPADLMHQAITHHNNTNILIIAASYLVTILVLLFVYAARLYINRSVLASIPKSWIPVEKSDGVPRRVREVITGDLSRSAAIAWGARPRLDALTGVAGGGGGSRLGTGMGMGESRGTSRSHVGGGGGSRGEDVSGMVMNEKKNGKGLTVAVQQQPSEKRTHRMISKLRRGSCVGGGGEKDIAKAAAVASVGIVPTLDDPARPPVWGEIEHPGWASPTSPDLPNLQYNAVISELPNLIEAKALTLAPRDPESRTEPPTLDPDAVAVLQRPETMGVRDYLIHLTEIEVLAPAVVGPFISLYESARFSTRPVSNQQFRELMHLFAEVLRGMQPLDPAVLLEEYDDDGDDDDYESAIYDTDIDNDAPRGTSSSSGGEESSIHGPTTINNSKNNDDAKSSRHSRRSNKLRNTNNNNNTTETYNNNTNVNDFLNSNNNFNNNNGNGNTNDNSHNFLTRQPSTSSSSNSTSSASLSSQRRYSTATASRNLTAPGTGTGGRNTPIMMRNSSANTWQHSHSHSHSQSQQFRTAPTTPKSRRTVLTTRSSRRSSSSTSRTGRSNRSGYSGVGVGGAAGGSSFGSFAQTRHPYIIESGSGSGSGSSEGEGNRIGNGSGDGSSMRSGLSGQSNGSGDDNGSVVIRLASGEEESVNGLPYILGRTIST